MLVNYVFESYGSGGLQYGFGKGKSDSMRTVIDCKLPFKKEFQFLKIFCNRPMRQGISKTTGAPCIRESVAYKEIFVFLLSLVISKFKTTKFW